MQVSLDIVPTVRESIAPYVTTLGLGTCGLQMTQGWRGTSLAFIQTQMQTQCSWASL